MLHGATAGLLRGDTATARFFAGRRCAALIQTLSLATQPRRHPCRPDHTAARAKGPLLSLGHGMSRQSERRSCPVDAAQSPPAPLPPRPHGRARERCDIRGCHADRVTTSAKGRGCHAVRSPKGRGCHAVRVTTSPKARGCHADRVTTSPKARGCHWQPSLRGGVATRSAWQGEEMVCSLRVCREELVCSRCVSIHSVINT